MMTGTTVMNMASLIGMAGLMADSITMGTLGQTMKTPGALTETIHGIL